MGHAIEIEWQLREGAKHFVTKTIKVHRDVELNYHGSKSK